MERRLKEAVYIKYDASKHQRILTKIQTISHDN